MVQATTFEKRKGESMNHSLPDSEILYSALVNKDGNFEGIFVVGVKTTGVFCRPTCTARKPKRANVEFFASAHDALLAGYRPARFARPWNIKGLPLTGLNHCWLKSTMIY